MLDFIIYHLPGEKVGCTTRLKKRSKEGYGGRELIILERISAACGPQFAGDVEWAYAEWFGYNKSAHYTNTWAFKLSSEQRKQFAKRGYAARSPETKTAEYLSKVGSVGGPKGIVIIARKNPELAARIRHKGAEANGRSPNNNWRQQLTCPHCGKTGNGGNMHRWHLDNCRSYHHPCCL